MWPRYIACHGSLRSAPARLGLPARPMSEFTAFERLALPVVRWLVKLWVRPSVLPDDVRNRYGGGRHVVYALEKRSVIDLAVLEYVCRERGLPDPLAPL